MRFSVASKLQFVPPSQAIETIMCHEAQDGVFARQVIHWGGVKKQDTRRENRLGGISERDGIVGRFSKGGEHISTDHHFVL